MYGVTAMGSDADTHCNTVFNVNQEMGLYLMFMMETGINGTQSFSYPSNISLLLNTVAIYRSSSVIWLVWAVINELPPKLQ